MALKGLSWLYDIGVWVELQQEYMPNNRLESLPKFLKTETPKHWSRMGLRGQAVECPRLTIFPLLVDG